ncbi:uncharacterized protein LOC111037044 [Myzus persicae]|uniref:uncharacterized protein LOC111037044 n=1 Tax=Myzus persicae TaxID=13164 RepID=UPI000B9396A3|nr:uncharacterized protein LOC111037044 [Myzus persicae]
MSPTIDQSPKFATLLSFLNPLFYNRFKSLFNHVLMDEQHSFRSGRSTTNCDAIFTSYVIDAFSNRSQVDVIYTDFAKAFDRVSHKALLEVLRTTGFGEPLISWFESYVTGRKKFPKIKWCVFKYG